MRLFLLVLIQIFIESAKACKECTCIAGNLEAEMGNLTVAEAFRMYNITPDYVPIAPEGFAQVEFATAVANLGNFIPPLRLADGKTMKYEHRGEHGYYTVIYIDLDSEPKGKVFALLMNLRDVELIVPTSGDVVVLFNPPIPKLGTGMHRHVQLLYQQLLPIDTNDEELIELSRYPYIPNLATFTRSFFLGEPIAGNFIRTELNQCHECSNEDDSFRNCQKMCQILSSCDNDEISQMQCGAGNQ